MSSVEILDAIPVEEPAAEAAPGPEPARYAEAAQVLERAVLAGCQDPNVLYMLALAHKRQGKTQEARNALRKIANPDANVFLQMGLLSLREKQLAQAEGEFARAWQMDPTAYETAYNLLLTRLTLGQVETCLELLPQAQALLSARAGSSLPPLPGRSVEEERRFLTVLQSLLRACHSSGASRRSEAALTELLPEDELRLLAVVRSLGQIDTALGLLQSLSEARPRSTTLRESYFEAALVKAKSLMDRCSWTEAEVLLKPLAYEKGVSRSTQAVLLNLLGCCACLTQDCQGGITYFTAALKLVANDPRVHQNLALAYELQGDLSQADPHWNRCIDLLQTLNNSGGSRTPVPADMPGYLNNLAFESLYRLANRYSEKEKWSSALSYVQRAQRLRPSDFDTLERLFHLYNQAKRPQDARRTLEQLRKLRPDEPQLELYELDLNEAKGLGDIERLLGDIDRVMKKYPDDPRVADKAVRMVGDIIPLMGHLCDQLTDQMSKVIDQVRNLPNYQVNWTAVRGVMRDLLKEFQKLRRITGKCLPLVSNDEHRRIVRDLGEHIDKKIEACRSMGA